MRRFAFVVYDKPVPQARPRFARLPKGGFRTYIPTGDQNARFNIRAAFLATVDLDFQPMTGAIRLEYTAYRQMPKNIPKKRRLTALPTAKPDLDNYTKQMEDALKGYAFTDDSLIVTENSRKRYVGGRDGQHITTPCWEVELIEYDEEN